MIPWEPPAFHEIPTNPWVSKDMARWFPGVEKWDKATPCRACIPPSSGSPHFPAEEEAPGQELNPSPCGSPSPGTRFPRATRPSAISEIFLPCLPCAMLKGEVLGTRGKLWHPFLARRRISGSCHIRGAAPAALRNGAGAEQGPFGAGSSRNTNSREQEKAEMKPTYK